MVIARGALIFVVLILAMLIVAGVGHIWRTVIRKALTKEEGEGAFDALFSNQWRDPDEG